MTAGGRESRSAPRTTDGILFLDSVSAGRVRIGLEAPCEGDLEIRYLAASPPRIRLEVSGE